MNHRTDIATGPASAVRWTARLWSIAAIVLLAGFVVGEGVNPSEPHEALGLVFFPLGICVGMVLAWWREALGGWITVGSLAAFYVLHVATSGALPRGFAWLAFAAPGFLFLVAWGLSRRTTRTGA